MGGAAKVFLATVYQKHSSLRTRKSMYRGWHLTNARRLITGGAIISSWPVQALVNVGRNYNGPKVLISYSYEVRTDWDWYEIRLHPQDAKQFLVNKLNK